MARIHRKDLTDLVVRTVAPGIAVWCAVVGFGLLITGPLIGLSRDEESVSKALAADRTAGWNRVTMVWSLIGNTEYVIAVCVVVTAVLVWRTRDLLYSAVPAIAISLQSSIFVLATVVIGRPRPQVIHLDPAPPTSSYPSGHVGAAMALYLSFALLATRIERTWLRVLTTGFCLALPLLVSFARLYRGMHHVTDVTVGILNGIACATLAYLWYRHRAAAPETVMTATSNPRQLKRV